MTKFNADRTAPPPQPPPRPFRTTPVFAPYVVIYLMFGALSAGYMAIALSAPDWLEDLTPSLSASPTPSVRIAESLAADIGALRDGLAQLQSDVAVVRTDVDATRARQTAFETQLTSIDQRTSAAIPSAAGSPPVAAGEPPQTPKVINADGAAPAATLETGSVAKTIATAAAPAATAPPAAPAIPSFGPAVVKPAPEPVGVKLSSGDSLDNLRVNWSVLSDNYGRDLKNLEPRYVINSDPTKPGFDLVVGPVKSKAEAQKLCKALAAKSVPCKVSDFIGNAL